jgi:hypothetical protein
MKEPIMKKMELYLKFINNRLQKHAELSNSVNQLNQSADIILASSVEQLPDILSNEQKTLVPRQLKHDKIKHHLSHIKMRLEKSLQMKNSKTLKIEDEESGNEDNHEFGDQPQIINNSSIEELIQ